MNKYIYFTNALGHCLIYLYSLIYIPCSESMHFIFIGGFVYKLLIQLYLLNIVVYDTIDKWYYKEKIAHLIFIICLMSSLDTKCLSLYLLVYIDLFYSIIYCGNFIKERCNEIPNADNINLTVNEAANINNYNLENYDSGDNYDIPETNLYIIPKTVIQISKNDEHNYKYDTTCVICLEEFTDIKYKIYNLCNHVFHKECINNWLRQKNECPICRL